MVIKRENINGKYYIVLRVKGRIAQRVKWNQSFKVNDAINIYKRTNSIEKGVKRQNLIYKVEVIDTRKKPKLSRSKDNYVRHTIKYEYRGKTYEIVGQTKGFRTKKELNKVIYSI